MTTQPTRTATPTATMSLYRKRILGLLCCVILLVGGIFFSIAIGSKTIDLATVLGTLTDMSPTTSTPADVTAFDNRVVTELRIPRTFIALVVGMALGVAGALIQGHTRNPLADPGILGINAGAALAVVAGFSLFGINTMTATTLIAFFGAVAATALIFGLARFNGNASNPLTLILSGAALSAVLSSITSGLILADEANLDRLRFWTVGSVAGRDMSVFWAILPVIAIAIVLAFTTAPTLNLLNLGDDVASSLGVNTSRARVTGMLLIPLLAGSATAAAGPVAFIGLVVPHIVRLFTGPDYRWILPYSALLGSTVLLYADVIGRVVARPGELQVGIVLAFIAAPLFLILVNRRKVVSL